MHFLSDIIYNKGLCNNYLEGVWETRGDREHRGKSRGERGGGLDVKFNTFRRGSITFFIPSHKLE